MLTCRSQGIFSWTYHIQRGDLPVAELEFRYPSGHYEIRFEGECLNIIREPRTLDLQLYDGDDLLATARNMTVDRASFQLETDHHRLELNQPNVLAPGFELLKDNHVVGRIALTLEGFPGASVDIEEEVPVLLQLFAFAVVAPLWRGGEVVRRSV